MNEEQKEKHDRLLNLLDEFDFSDDVQHFKNNKVSITVGEMHEMVLTIKAYADIYPSLCAFDAAGDEATQGEWDYIDWKEQKKRGIDPYAYDETLPIFSCDGEVVMGFGNTECYYPSAGEEPKDQDADFITIAANMRSKIKGGLV